MVNSNVFLKATECLNITLLTGNNLKSQLCLEITKTIQVVDYIK